MIKVITILPDDCLRLLNLSNAATVKISNTIVYINFYFISVKYVLYLVLNIKF